MQGFTGELILKVENMNLLKRLFRSRKTKWHKPALCNNAHLDYLLKNGDKVWFTYRLQPKDESDWIEAEILDLNWANKAAAIQLKGLTGVSCCGISALSRERYYC